VSDTCNSDHDILNVVCVNHALDSTTHFQQEGIELVKKKDIMWDSVVTGLLGRTIRRDRSYVILHDGYKWEKYLVDSVYLFIFFISHPLYSPNAHTTLLHTILARNAEPKDTDKQRRPEGHDTDSKCRSTERQAHAITTRNYGIKFWTFLIS
jgi:hypothetical protein